MPWILKLLRYSVKRGAHIERGSKWQSEVKDVLKRIADAKAGAHG